MWTSRLISEYRKSRGWNDLSNSDLEKVHLMVNAISCSLLEANLSSDAEPSTVFLLEGESNAR